MSCGSRCGCSAVSQRKPVVKPKESGCGCGSRPNYQTYESYGCCGPTRQVSSPRYGCGTGGGCGCGPSGNIRTLPAEPRNRGCGCGPSADLPSCGPRGTTRMSTPNMKNYSTPTSAKKSKLYKIW